MSVSWARAVAVLVLSGAPAAAVEQPSPVERIDAALADVNRLQAAFGRCAETRAELAAGGPAFVPRLDADIVMHDLGMRDLLAAELIVGQTCRALVSGRSEPCDSLADLPGRPESGQRICSRLFRMGQFSAALLARDKTAPAACARWCELAPKLPPPDVIAQVCDALVTRGDYPLACDNIASWTHPGPGYVNKECAWEMKSLLGLGSEDFCRTSYRSGNTQTPGAEICVATGLYRAAKAGGSPEKCRANPLCRALLDPEPATCRPLEEALEKKAGGLFGGQALPVRLARLNKDCLAISAHAAREIEVVRGLLKGTRGEVLADLEAKQKAAERAGASR
ncbi:MAG: hypothetical protein KGL74_13575 [Elusimicrobia bacterium]|nr:hypothetical protein [Elusimicrobiota bacterium]MDE2512149.1 hypothetical protein [Elusimicrobiota bacterium]